MVSIDPTLLAAGAAVFGGAGVKIVEHWVNKNRVKVDDATQIRDELRKEIISQREEIKSLEDEVGLWRRDYYELRDKYIRAETTMTLELERIRLELSKFTQE